MYFASRNVEVGALHSVIKFQGLLFYWLFGLRHYWSHHQHWFTAKLFQVNNWAQQFPGLWNSPVDYWILGKKQTKSFLDSYQNRTNNKTITCCWFKVSPVSPVFPLSELSTHLIPGQQAGWAGEEPPSHWPGLPGWPVWDWPLLPTLATEELSHYSTHSDVSLHWGCELVPWPNFSW